MLFVKCRLVALAVGLAGLTFVSAPIHAGTVGFASHRAVYDLALDHSEQAPNLSDLSGRIVMEFTGSQCDGYSMALRFLTEIYDPDGERRVTDARTVTFEDGDGAGFNFKNEVFVDKTLSEETRGSASRTNSGVSVELTKPGEKNFVLDESVVFPTEQIERIIEAALRHQNFMQIDVYDGAEGGEAVYSTTAVIGPSLNNSDDIGDEIAAMEGGVSGLQHWRVAVSYFNQETAGERTPIYVMSFILYENGVSRQLKIDYGDFAITGRLSGLEMLPADSCP